MATITRKGTALFYTIYQDIDVSYEAWDDIKEALSLLSRHAVTHRKLAEYACNGDPIRQQYGRMDASTIDRIAQEREEAAEKRSDNIEARIKELAERLPYVTLEMQGDPRGSTVKLIVDNRTYYLN